MAFYADLHIHSKYSRATSRDCDLEHLSWWAQHKGLAVVATGDFTHPAWWQELQDKLVPAEPGLFRLRPDIEREIASRVPGPCRQPTRFLLEVEISTIYKRGEKTRKIHHLIYAPDMDTAGHFRDRLGSIGNIASDGRPILGLDSRDLLEITLESGPGAYLIPAHVWTPWFAVLGSKGGFDSVDECYGDLAEHIFAVETGLSSDPPMNWRVSQLDRFTLVSNSDAHSPPMLGREASVFDCQMDYFSMRQALHSGEGYGGTLEFFPEEGKYHMDGHRACGVRLEPARTRQLEGRCPACNKPLTVGVMHRVEDLADRPEASQPENAAPYRNLVPLPEIVSELEGVGPKSKRVGRRVAGLVERLGPELQILQTLPAEELKRAGDPILGEAVQRLRSGHASCQAGYDGEYGVVRLFEPEELARKSSVGPSLFAPEELPAPPKKTKRTVRAAPAAAGATPTTTGPAVDAPGTRSQTGERPAPREPGREAVLGRDQQTQKDLENSPLPDSEQQSEDDRDTDITTTEVSPVLSGLDPEQRAAAEVGSGPFLVLAGPGTGKTRTLTHRLAHLVLDHGVPARECLAVTFTRRAAEELSQRLRHLLEGAADGMLCTTFHGLGLEILRREHGSLGLDRAFELAAPGRCLELAQEIFDLGRKEAAGLLSDLSLHRRERITSAQTLPDAKQEHGGEAPTVDAEIEARLETWRTALMERDLVDFDGLLELPLALLREQPELQQHYRQRWTRVAVDEYQDIDALQYALLRQLVPSDGHLMAIGDPDQSIYAFRGANVGFFLRFQQDFPTAQVVELRRNYRSSRTIVQGALRAVAPQSLAPGRELLAMNRSGAAPLEIHVAASEKAEAEHVAHTIEKLLGGTSYFSIDSGRVDGQEGEALSFNDVAVLYRTEAQGDAVVEALGRAGIPHQRRSHHRLSKHPGVRALMDRLRTDHQDDAVQVAVLLERVAAELGEPGRRAAALLSPLATTWGSDLEGFLEALTLGEEVDTWDPRAERVSLLTLHAAKGLEFPVVFLVGLEEELMPLRFPGAETDLAEERRLLFVGMTRAERRLFLSWARKRRVRGEVQTRHASPFLDELQGLLLERVREAPARNEKGPKQLRLL